MLHPEFARYANRPSVDAARKAYRAAWLAHDGSFERGRDVKAAEDAVNAAVEDCIASAV